SSSTSTGRTGMTMPIATASSTATTRRKAMAARREALMARSAGWRARREREGKGARSATPSAFGPRKAGRPLETQPPRARCSDERGQGRWLVRKGGGPYAERGSERRKSSKNRREPLKLLGSPWRLLSTGVPAGFEARSRRLGGSHPRTPRRD